MSLVELLRNLRADKKAKLEEVAKVMNVTRKDYFQMEKGFLVPNSDQLENVSNFYGVNKDVFSDFIN